MDIWVTSCRRRAKCRYCPKYVEVGEPIVKGKLWLNREGSAKTWCIYFYWHLKCWEKQALESIEKQKREETRGKRAFALSDEDRKKRRRMLLRRGALLQRMKAAMRDGNVDKLIHLGHEINKLKEEIEPLGGIPKTWT